MVDFFANNWKDIIEIIVSLVVGLIGGYAYKSIKVKTNIKGNNNTVIQNVGGNNNGK